MSAPRIRSGSCCSGPAHADDLSHHEEPSDADIARFGHDGRDDDGYDDHAFEDSPSNPWTEHSRPRALKTFVISVGLLLALTALLVLSL